MLSKKNLIFFLLLITSIPIYPESVNQIKTGMKSEEIIKILGAPFKIIKDPELEYQLYIWNIKNELKYVLMKNNLSESELLNLEDMLKGFLSLAGLKDTFSDNTLTENNKKNNENKPEKENDNVDIKLLNELKNKIIINVIECKTYDSLMSGKTAGFRLKIENQSDKSIKYLKIVVYFYNKQGKIFYEQEYNAVNSESWTEPFILKPNYILKYPAEDDQFFSVKGVDLAAWDEGKIKVEIVKIEVE